MADRYLSTKRGLNFREANVFYRRVMVAAGEDDAEWRMLGPHQYVS